MSEDKQLVPDQTGDPEKAALKAEEANQKDGAAVVPGPDLDQSKVKFINGADASIDLGKPSDQFTGLTKEELLQYAKDPYWVRLRIILLVLFWVAWFAMLTAAIIIIVLAPKCPPRPNLEWWQKSVVYQAYPRSFKDSNGDGTGDLKGIESQLDYLRKDLNVTALWLNPIYPSGGKDTGYDITDHKSIDPVFGTMDDFRSLLGKMHRRDMKLVMDFVPNHVSSEHPWFKESLKSKSPSNKFRNYFVWANGTNGGPPNNWKSVFGGSAWTFDPSSDEYYLHQFLPEQPDLNLRNSEVREELKSILRFWLDLNVDGFRVDAAAHLFESEDLTKDEPVIAGRSGASYEDLQHSYTTFQPEGYQLVTAWRELLDNYTAKTERVKFITVESYGKPEQTLPFYEYNNRTGADFPLNMVLTKLGDGGQCGGRCVNDAVHEWIGKIPSDRWSNWMVGNHDKGRVGSRMTDTMVNVVNMLLLLLPGTPFVYYGDEIGMMDNTNIPLSQRKDEAGPVNRDPERTPMQWSDQLNAGFSTANQTWLPVNSDYKSRNVRVQKAQGTGTSNLEVFSSLTLLRQEPSFQWGAFHDVLNHSSLVTFVRQAYGFDGYLVVLNFGPDPATPDFHLVRPNLVPPEGIIVAHSHNFAHQEDFVIGKVIKLDQLHLKPGEGLVCRWSWEQAPKV